VKSEIFLSFLATPLFGILLESEFPNGLAAFLIKHLYASFTVGTLLKIE
jgi:hypothetical protein